MPCQQYGRKTEKQEKHGKRRIIIKIRCNETKTGGFVGTKQYTVAASGGKTYIPMHATSAYIVIINAYAQPNTLRGMYLIGSNSSNVLGIKAISTASDAELVDSGTIGGQSGVLRITNNGSVAMRVTVITTTGAAV